MKLCQRVTKFTPGKDSSEKVLNYNLEELDDTEAIIIIRMNKDRSVETTWSRTSISTIAYMERCLGLEVTNLLNEGKTEDK